MKDTAYCLICDTEVGTGAAAGLTLTFNQETSAVKLCDECKEIAKSRDYL